MKTATQIALILLILSPSVTLAQQPDFTGTWERNDRLSQNPFEKIDIAMGAGDASGAGTNTYNAVNRGTFLRDRDGAAQRRLLLDYVEVLEVIEIEHARGELQLSVGEGDEFFSLFYLDGEPHARELQDGERIEAIARWEGDTIRVEQKVEGGASLVEVFTMMPSGDQIAMIFHLTSQATNTPVLFRTVYERTKED